MRIIKNNKDYTKNLIGKQITCKLCNSILEIEENDLPKMTFDTSFGFLTNIINCPICNNDITIFD